MKKQIVLLKTWKRLPFDWKKNCLLSTTKHSGLHESPCTFDLSCKWSSYLTSHATTSRRGAAWRPKTVRIELKALVRSESAKEVLAESWSQESLGTKLKTRFLWPRGTLEAFWAYFTTSLHDVAGRDVRPMIFYQASDWVVLCHQQVQSVPKLSRGQASVRVICDQACLSDLSKFSNPGRGDPLPSTGPAQAQAARISWVSWHETKNLFPAAQGHIRSFLSVFLHRHQPPRPGDQESLPNLKLIVTL